MSNNTAYACYTCNLLTSSLLVANSSIQVSYFNWFLVTFQYELGVNFYEGEGAITQNTCKQSSNQKEINAWVQQPHEMLRLTSWRHSLLLLQIKHDTMMINNARSGQDQLVWTLDMGSKLKGKHCTTKLCTPTLATTLATPSSTTHPGPLSSNHFKKGSLLLCGKGTHTSSPTTLSKHLLF